MKRIIAVLIPLIILVMVGSIISLLEAQQTPSWKIELDNYINQTKTPQESIKIAAVVDAKQPWNFDNTMGIPASHKWPWGIEKLPYPPVQLKCVQLENGNSDDHAMTQHIVFVGYYDDNVWRSGWLVHESLNGAEVERTLKQIGCDLHLE